MNALSESLPTDDEDSFPISQRGSAGASFVLLYVRHQKELYAYIASLLPNWTEADDAMQETSLALWAHFSRWDPSAGSFIAWACGVAYHRILRRRRQLARDRLQCGAVFEAVACQADSQVDELESRRKALDGCIQKLPTPSRSLLEACYAGDRNIREVAESFGQSAKAVYKTLGRIRDGLTNCVNAALASENS